MINDNEVIKQLIAVARAAHNLTDCACEECGYHTVDTDSFKELSVALDALDELPEPSEKVVGTGPAKAEAFLNRR